MLERSKITFIPKLYFSKTGCAHVTLRNKTTIHSVNGNHVFCAMTQEISVEHE